tara:strand:+ start:21092 stop:21319 length:228 start_codon:yes stop_codon:yes gene_type:complete
MSALLMSGLVVAIMYVIFRFIEMRFILKENKPLKVLFRDTIIVYLSTVSGLFVLDQFASNVGKSAPKVFTDIPNF